MGNKKSIGLPSGPNEFLKDITQHISVDGYKRYSEDVNNPYNIIESGNITMEDVDFPVKGTDNLGNEQIMMPGMNYQFPGDSVLEVPMAQEGAETKIYNKPIEQEEGIVASIDNFVTPILRKFTGRAGTNDDVSLRVPPGEMKFFRNNEQPVNSDYIIGGDYMEDTPTAYKASEYPNTMYTTQGQTQEIDFETQQFYGVVNGNIKLGKKADFKDDDVIVPLRPNFGGNFSIKQRESLDPEFIEKARKFNEVTNKIRESAYFNPEQKVWEEMNGITLLKKFIPPFGGFKTNPEYKDIIDQVNKKFGKGSYMYDLEPMLNDYNSNGYDILNPAGNQLDTFGNKVILFDPESNEHLFISQLREEKRNKEIIAFKEKYPNANYLNLDNGRFSNYMVNKDGITSDNAKEYMQNSFEGPDATGYNFAYQEGGDVPKAQNGNGEYKVQKGDTFYGIANKNNVSWDTLKEANPNVNIERLGLNQNIIIPKAIDRSPAIPENQVDNSNVLDYKSISNYLVDSRGGTMDTWGQLADTIAFHESSPWSRMDPKAKQYKGGPGRGLFQFEGESFNTALKRYKNVAAAKGYTLKNSIVNAKSADELSSEDQYALFYANLIESKTKLSDFVDGNISSLDVWLSGHKNVEADGDRNSFLESKTAAEKEGIKNGYKTFQEGGEKYKVSSGDNLGKIANKYKTSVDELVRLNNISDPNKISINQELIVPEIPEESTLNKYTIKSGDTLGKLATKYNTSVNQLAALNNIKDVNKISIDQELILPDSYREEKPLKEESWYSVDDIQKNNNKVNDLTDENIIINSQLLNNPNQSYVVIDKKTQRLKLYRGDEVDLDFEVLTGANDGDAQTVTNVIDYNKDGITTEADKRGGKYKTDWMAGNRSTGAGVYTINQSAPTSENRYQNAPSFNLLNESGIQVGTSIHGTPGFRNKFFDDGNLENNSASNGCINGKCSDLQALYNMNLPTGTPVFILPEDEGNSFQQVDGKAVMRMSSKNRKDYLEYTDLRGDEQEGQGGNYSTSTLSYKPIRAKLDKELFEEKVYSAFDFNDDEEFNNTTQPFISALEKNKKDIMLAAQIPGDVYNQIAKMAFGIYGTESNFGDTHSATGNVGRAATKYFDREGSSSPDVVSKYDTYNVQGDNNSVGYTQIRWSQLNDKEKSALKSFDITSNKDFLNPEKSAIATATILGIRYNEQLTADQKKDVWKNLPSKWNNRSNYSSRVKSNSRYLQFEQLDRLQKGGEIENNIMYKNYIDGVYTGSKMESKAEKIYDKLNRLHYRDAKAKQMTPANYVLTHVIG